MKNDSVTRIITFLRENNPFAEIMTIALGAPKSENSVGLELLGGETTEYLSGKKSVRQRVLLIARCDSAETALSAANILSEKAADFPPSGSIAGITVSAAPYFIERDSLYSTYAAELIVTETE